MDEKEILQFIKKNNMFQPGDVVGVAVSGGADSMSLLSFLCEKSEDLDISVVAITIDHMLRGEKSIGDALFVKTWCRERNIPCWKYSVDAPRISKEKNLGVEEGAREARYSVFNRLLEENKVDKIALAHHLSDQAETILMHILRGAGLNGASGMEPVRGKYVRPFLFVSKDDIVRYCSANSIEHVEDETNSDSSYNRNYLRNVVLPQLKMRWEGVEQNLVNFSLACKEDNEFILSQVSHDGVIYGERIVKIPLMYFHYNSSVINRIIFDAIEKIAITKDIERKHIELIKGLADADNGKKINLPNNLIAQKEYDYISLYKTESPEIIPEYDFEVGKTNFGDMFEISVKRVKSFDFDGKCLYMDVHKVPAGAKWRIRHVGDTFTKFGGGSKSLKDFFIDRKIPNRLRSLLPVLAYGKEILCIPGIEISDKVKIDDSTYLAYAVSMKELEKGKKLSTYPHIEKN